MHKKYIFTFGGVMSGLGKGGVTASLAKTFHARGYRTTAVKIDPYINIDAGLFSPYEHGEVFVLDDGGEVDQDLGNYERFINLSMTRDHNITTGKVYSTVIEKERRGDYLGKTVQIIPHATDEIKRRIVTVSEQDNAQITFIEVGGTVGDIESMPFLEAARQLKFDFGSENVIFCHLALVPELKVVGEQKTKPTQHSVKTLLEMGIQPDVIICRSKREIEPDNKKKIAMFCNVPQKAVISDPDIDTIYKLPFVWEKEGLCDFICERLRLGSPDPQYETWKRCVENMDKASEEVNIAITGKYTKLKDSYLSILESIKHACAALNVKPNVHWVETTNFNPSLMDKIDGIIVPGGFGSRGTEGKVQAINFARTNNIPFLGLCFGFQLAVVEYARNVCGIDSANSTEIDPETKSPVIAILEEQKNIEQMGATMRLGAYDAELEEGTQVYKLYNSKKISERHRHRFEVNPDYISQLEKKGLVFSGKSPDRHLMEFLELPGHPFFVGTQAHPEFKSRLDNPAPLFYGFVKAIVDKK